MHLVGDLVDDKRLAPAQPDLRQLDGARQLEDLERQALQCEHLQPPVLRHKEPATFPHSHAAQDAKVAWRDALAPKGAEERPIKAEDLRRVAGALFRRSGPGWQGPSERVWGGSDLKGQDGRDPHQNSVAFCIRDEQA